MRNAKKTFWGNAIGNVANQKSTTLPRPDDSGHYFDTFVNSCFKFQLVIVIQKDQMVILAIIVVYAVAKLISLVANVIHVRLDISTFLLAKVKSLIHIHTHIVSIQLFQHLKIKFQLVLVIHKGHMVLLAMPMEYVVVKQI